MDCTLSRSGEHWIVRMHPKFAKAWLKKHYDGEVVALLFPRSEIDKTLDSLEDAGFRVRYEADETRTTRRRRIGPKRKLP